MNEGPLLRLQKSQSYLMLCKKKDVTGGGGAAHRFWWKNVKGKENMEDLNKVERVILIWILKKQHRWGWSKMIWPRKDKIGGFL
jgi:hypothetical protein